MIREKLKDHYSTSDIALATTLSLFYPLEVVDRTNPHKAQFLFKRDDQIDQLIETYWRGEIKINPQAYFAALKNLKSRLYANE